VARYLSTEWVQAFDAALEALDLSDAVTAAAAGSFAASDGDFRVAQVVSGVPAEVAGASGSVTGSGSEVRVVLSVSEGRAHMALDPDGALGPANATIALGYADALALALGRLDPADALAAGRVRVRGDLAALVAGQEVLAAAAGLLGSTLDDLTDPIDSADGDAAGS
jgi:hypothetical protein